MSRHPDTGARTSAWAAALALVLAASEAAAQTRTNFIRQVHQATGVQWDVSVGDTGTRQAVLPVLPGGSRFELWTIESHSMKNFLLDVKFVDVNLPKSNIRIVTEDPCTTVVRTRADRPFRVEVTTSGLLSSLGLPLLSDLVVVYRHVQAYGSGEEILGLPLGGLNLNFDQGILLSAGTISGNGTKVLHYPITAIPGPDRAKVMGEERFSVVTLPDLGNPLAPLAMKFLQVWPVADGLIEGIDEGQTIRGSLPEVVLTAHDLYPDSQTYAQIYPGGVRNGVGGAVVPGSAVVVNHQVPQNRQLRLSDWDEAVPDNGRWTLELLTVTPFGTDRLDHVTFDVQRALKVRGSLSSLD